MNLINIKYFNANLCLTFEQLFDAIKNSSNIRINFFIPMIKNCRYLSVIFSILSLTSVIKAQPYSFDWQGSELVPKTTFLNPAKWTTNVANAGLGDKSVVGVSADTLELNWTYGAGNRYKFAQCYLYFTTPVSLANFDLFAFNLQGMPNKGSVGFELKFEDGTHQAAVSWDNLAGLNRWANKISAAKKQFSNAAVMDWSKVKVISLAVYSQASASYTTTDQGKLRIYNLVGASMAGWLRAASQEFIDHSQLTTINQNAINFIINRQKSTGLLTTWSEDNSSWLYGQGLALKALSLAGSWNAGTPSNSAAVSAEKLALFLANHQQPEGYWPRAWNSVTGAITVLREADGTVWMGDFPWIITGLQAYYKRSGDQRVIAAIQKGLNFLYPLIQPDGKFYTINPQTGVKSEVASSEAYAAAILSLFESGDNGMADKLYTYIFNNAWDNQLRCWREATYSDRIVLFANTWMSYYLFQKGETQAGLDALSLAGKVLYTAGNGEVHGMDGIVPLAVWYEGTLSYIAAGGPGSISLFNELQTNINLDGSVMHYNENLGGIGGIWAVDWHSLDGTSWLYFATAGKSPFDQTDGIAVNVSKPVALDNRKNFSVTHALSGELLITTLNPVIKKLKVRITLLDGRVISESNIQGASAENYIKIPAIAATLKMVVVQIYGSGISENYPLLLN